MRAISRVCRHVALLGTSGLILQFTGCSTANLVEFIQTILLGVTAAGSLVIIQNL